MTDTFLYEDGVELSLGASYTFIQNIANNRIRNFTRILTQSAGFLDDSFEVVALEKDTSQSSTYYLKLKIGGVVFPNGEVFKGNDFVCRVALSKSSATQYLKVKHISLKRTAQEQAFGDSNYAEIMDGVKLSISNDPDTSDDGTELLIVSIDYLPDMDAPDCSDRRDPWIFYWSASTIINPLEILDFDVDDIYIISSKSVQSSALNTLDSYDMNSETSTIVYIKQISDEARHAWDLIVESSYPETNMGTRRMEPYPEMNREPYVIMRLPNGLEAIVSLRKHDAYRSGVDTDWATAESKVISHVDEDTITTVATFKVHDTQPYLGVRIYTTEDLGTSCFVKIWLSDQDNIDTETPPGFILGLPTNVDTASLLPYILLPYNILTQTLYLSYEVISPAHNILKSDYVEISTALLEFGEEEVFCIYFNSDRRRDTQSGMTTEAISSDDEDGYKIFYAHDQPVVFSIPLSNEWPTDAEGIPYGRGPELYLKEIEFFNYANYPAWSHNASFDYDPGTLDSWINVTYNPPVVAGDIVNISGSTAPTALANGAYTVKFKSYIDGTNWILCVNDPAAISGPITTQGCVVADDSTAPMPRATIEILSGVRSGIDPGYSGSIQLGQDRGVHFPDTFYTDHEDIDDPYDDNIFYEGRSYYIKFTRVSGGWEDRMNIMGVLKLKFVRKKV